MPFITDRDLLVLQPSLFREISYLSQTLLRGSMHVESGQLMQSGTLDFPSSIQPGQVALVGDRPLEIVERSTSSSLTVSLTRAESDADVLVPPDSADAPTSIVTFAPQIALVHHQILRMLGLDTAEQSIDPDAPSESAILNPRDLALVEAVGTLHLLYSTAAAALSTDSPLAARAAYYRERFAQERWRARAIIDTDGDGRADAVRAMNTVRLTPN